METAFDPNKAVVILLGAKEWPHFPELNHSASLKKNPFQCSFEGIRDYFLQDLRVPKKQVLALFNLEDNYLETAQKMTDFLRAFKSIEDIFLYYVGHGIIDLEGNYCLTLHRFAQTDSLGAFTFPVASLARILREFKYLRRYIILDACFSGNARKYLASPTGIEHVVEEQIFQNIPKSGSLLFCSSSGDKVSVILEKEHITLFTSAMLKVLKQGDTKRGAFLSFDEVAELTREWIKSHSDQIIIPELHIPEQEEGNIGHNKIFPNPKRWCEEVKEQVQQVKSLKNKRLVKQSEQKTRHFFKPSIPYLLFTLVSAVIIDITFLCAMDVIGFPCLKLSELVEILRRLSEPPSESSNTPVENPKTETKDSFQDCPECPEMVNIPAGSFMMGSENGEDNEKPVHRVEISAFAMGKYEITRGQFRQFAEATGYKTEAEKGGGCYSWAGSHWDRKKEFTWRDVGFSQEDIHPVVCVSWNDAIAYTKWLTKTTGKTYRLPTEAEWEYAARAQTATERFWGDNPDEACRYANVADKTAQKQFSDWTWTIHNCTDGYTFTAPVGIFKPNAFKLHDMLGNVWEWTCSRYTDSYDGSEQKCDINQEDARVLRDGSWDDRPNRVRSAARNWNFITNGNANFGFRVVVSSL